MILTDTHILVWLNEDQGKIPRKLLAALEAETDLRVSPISGLVRQPGWCGPSVRLTSPAKRSAFCCFLAEVVRKLKFPNNSSFWEIAMLVDKGRILLPVPVLPWLRQALKYPGMGIVPLTPEIAARAGSLPMRGDPADRLIAATAIESGCALASLDEQMPRVPGLNLVAY